MQRPAPVARRITILRPHVPLCCPFGHKQDKHVWSIGERPLGGERCRKKLAGGECGACVFWWLLPDGSRLVIEVSSHELHDMEQGRMDFTQALDYLGLTWSRSAA